MLFSSSLFLYIFLPCIMFGYYVVFRRSRKWQNILLLCGSLFFYAWGEPWFVLVMLFVITIDWASAKLLPQDSNNKRHKLIITAMVVVNLSFLFVFKYLTFVLDSVKMAVGGSWTVPVLRLPIGISFFIFQAMSYVFDVARGKAKPAAWRDTALYVSFFPQLIAGPIVRYSTIAEEINNRKENFDDFSNGMCRFIAGLGKKVLLANTLGYVADKAFGMANPGMLFAWEGVLAYTFQIFFDFRGYSDMAIGLGWMFGFHFEENFNYPYIAKSITEFWRRWHISLGTWFRDYVYFPLGGSRVKTKARVVLNLLVVWMLTGIWHGANWTFVIWGLMYAVLIIVEKLTGFAKKIGQWGHLYTLLFVVAGWVVFRAENLAAAGQYFGAMLGLNGAGLGGDVAFFWLRENKFFFLFAALLSMPTAKWVSKRFSQNKAAQVAYVVGSIIVFIVSLSYIMKGAYNPFI